MKFDISKRAEKRPVEITKFGQTRIDNYAWIRDENWKEILSGNLNFSDSKILEYIENENKHTQEFMDLTKELKKEIYDELLARIKEDNETYPFKKGEYYYFSKEEKGKNYPFYCRKRGSLDAEPEVYFDVNKEAEPYDLFMLGAAVTSKDNKFMAYAYNTSGSLEYIIKVRDLESGKDLDWSIPHTTGDFEWAEDSTHLYYILRDEESGRGKELKLLNVQEGLESTKSIFTKPENFSDTYMSFGVTTSEKYGVITLNMLSCNQSYILDMSNFSSKPELVAKAVKGVEYSIEHYQDKFLIKTNDGNAQNFKIMQASIGDFSKPSWKEFIKEKAETYISDFHIYGDELVLEERDNERALSVLRIMNLSTMKDKVISMPQDAYEMSFAGAYEPDAVEVRVYYSSPSQPSQTIDLNLKTAELVVKKTKEVPNFNSDNYEVKRVFAKAHDGEMIPLTLTYKKTTKLDGSAPSYIKGYGSYGYAYPASFEYASLSLMDRGFVCAIAHVRGGEDKGHKWYLDGKMMKKKNTFFDFISCCEYLIENNYTSKGNIVAQGGSAGGLLMGAIANMKPDLFKAIIADVAFVDVINTISDPSLPLTPPEWEEWGNPIEDEEAFNYMMSYSPYDNVKAQDYPHMLFNSGISDEQVTYWEPTKMVAKLRELKTDSHDLYLNMKMHAGHAGASKKYEGLDEMAFNLAFAIYMSQN